MAYEGISTTVALQRAFDVLGGAPTYSQRIKIRSTILDAIQELGQLEAEVERLQKEAKADGLLDALTAL